MRHPRGMERTLGAVTWGPTRLSHPQTSALFTDVVYLQVVADAGSVGIMYISLNKSPFHVLGLNVVWM